MAHRQKHCVYFPLSCEHTLLTVAFIGCIHHFTWCWDTLRKTICILLHQAELCLLVWEQSDSPNKFVLGCWGECYTRAIIILRCNNHSGFIAHRAFPSIHCTADKLTQWQSLSYDKNSESLCQLCSLSRVQRMCFIEPSWFMILYAEGNICGIK